MRYRLRSLLLASVIGPPVLAVIWWVGVAIVQALSSSPGVRGAAPPPGSPALRGAVCAAILLYPLAAMLFALASRVPAARFEAKALELAALLVAAMAALAALIILIAPT